MSSNKTSFTYTEYLFRPVYELQTAAAWGTAACLSPVTGFAGLQSSWSVTLGVTAACGAGACYYATKAVPMIKKQMGLQKNTRTFTTTSKLRKQNQTKERATKRNFKDPRENMMGYGFEWGPEHAQRAYQVMDLDSNLSGVKPPWPFGYLSRRNEKETRELGGKPYIHALGEEQLITAVEDTFYGHTLIVGNIGCGKTTALRLLSLNALHMSVGRQKKIILVLDPKNDSDWKRALKEEMNYLGMGDKFYTLHPAKQNESCRVPLLKNYVRITEIADRIAPLMGTSGGSKTFEDFSFEQLTFVAQGLEYMGTPIRLTTIRDTMGTSKFKFCLDVLRHYMQQTLGNGWQATSGLTAHLNESSNNSEVDYLAEYYKNVLKERHPEQAVDGIIQFLEHPHEHFVKMITSLKPVLTTLTTKPMDDLFSPIHDIYDDDPRPIIDLEKMLETGGCIYMSMDSLTDSKTAGFISRLVMAEVAAVAGRRYNNEDKDAPRVSVFIDEAHAALENNNAMLNLLSQGRAAALELYLSTQTVSDLIAMTDEPTANRILGLCNNIISMRTTDPKTQEYIASQFSKTSIKQVQKQQQSGVSTGKSIFEFSSSDGARTQISSEDSFPQQLMGDLPKLQYIARLADGRKLKMRLPIVLNDSKDQVASWV